VASALHDELVERLQYFDGHSDTLGLFAGPGFFKRAAEAVAEPFRDAGISKVAGIEARGFVLATAVGLELGAGLATLREAGSVHPGPKVELTAPPDSRGHDRSCACRGVIERVETGLAAGRPAAAGRARAARAVATVALAEEVRA
jgi:hypothetical protein